jgi:hypothetical protein
MNIAIQFIRIILSLGYWGLACRMADGSYWYAAFAAVVIGMILLLPVLKIYLQRSRLKSVPFVWRDIDDATKFRWIRKGIVAFSGFTVVGAFQRHKYEEGIAIGIICLTFLSPLDKCFFGPPTPFPPADPVRSIRHMTIIACRNAGWLFYTGGLFIFIDHDSDTEAIIYMVTGYVLLFARPVVMLLEYYRIIPPMPILPLSESEPVATLPMPPLPNDPPVDEPLPDDQQEAVQPDLALLKADYLALLLLEAHARGYAFQRFLHQLFEAHHIITRSAFRLTGEEIDGSFDLGAQTYLLEAKWHAKPTDQSDLLVFNGKVEGKSTWARGIFISYAGFTADGLTAFRHGKRTSIIGMDGNDLLLILDGHITLDNAIRRKAMKAVENNDFFVPLISLL